MVESTPESLDARIFALTDFFEQEDVIVAGGLAAYLNTGIFRQTDDVDLITLNPEKVGSEIINYQRKINCKVDHTFPNNVFDSISLEDPKLRERTVRIQNYESGSVAYLGPEAIIATKLTSFCNSGEEGQPTSYGLKVLRDKDIDDITNLQAMSDVDEELLYDLLDTVPHLSQVPTKEFYKWTMRAIGEQAPMSFKKNAFGIGRLIAHISEDQKEVKYLSLMEESRTYQTAKFAVEIQNDFQESVDQKMYERLGYE